MSIYSPIEIDRIILREFIEDDIDCIYKYLSDPEVCKYMVFEPLSVKQSREYLNKFLIFQNEVPRKYIRFAIILKDCKEFIGECGLNMPNIEHKKGEIVYRLNRDYWGEGYATEAAKGVIDFSFKILKLHRIAAWCDTRNKGSIKVLEKAGMKREGCLREHKLIKGVWRSSYVYSCLNPRV